MKFNDYLIKRVQSGDTLAARYLKKGKVPLQLILDEAKMKGYRPELIEAAERKGMLQGDLEMTYDGALAIYNSMKDLVKKRSSENKGEWVDLLDHLDPIKDHEVIANVLFCLDPEIRKKVGDRVDGLYRVVLNVGTGQRKGYHPSLKNRKGDGEYLITPELEKIVSSIPEREFNAESEESRRLRAILKRKAEGEIFPVFKKDEAEAFSLLEKKIESEKNPNLKRTYEEVRDRYKLYSKYKVDVANTDFIDPETKQKVSLPSLHQKIAIYHIINEGRFGVFDGCGTGKTAIATLAQPLVKKAVEEEGAEFRRTVIVCPNNAKKAWKQGLMGESEQRYLKEKQDVLVINGERKDAEFFERLEKAKWILLNKEQLNTRVNGGKEVFAQALSRIGIDYLIFDEAHNFKSQRDFTSRGRLTQSGAARLLAKDVKYLSLLSGTPIPDQLDDYGVLFHLLNPKVCPDPKRFRELFEDNARVLYTLFNEKTIRRTSEDINEELDWNDIDLEVDLNSEQRKLYDHIIEFRPSNWLVQARKALLDPRLVHPEILQRAGVLGKIGLGSSSKYKKLEELLASSDGPLRKKEKFVIFSSMFREGVTQEEHQDLKELYAQMNLSHLYDSLKLDKSLADILKEGLRARGIEAKIGVIDGTKEVEEREKLVDKLHDGLDGLLVTTDTGGESLSFVSANWAYSLDEDYAPKTEEQKRARLLRKGQTKTVNFVNLRGKETLDIPLRDYVRKKVVINTIAVDGMPLTNEEMELLNDTEGKRFGEMVKRGLGGKSINVLEAEIKNFNDFDIIKRNKGISRGQYESMFSYNTTEAQELMKWIGKDPVNCWKDPAFVELYMKTLPSLAVPVVHRAKISDLIRRAKEGQIDFPKMVISEGSGPSLLYDSYQGLADVIKKEGYEIPKITDRDFSQLMLDRGRNPNKILGDMTGKGSKVNANSFDMVDNESISLLRNEDEVKSSLLEANRILKPGKGIIELIVKNMRFVPDFYQGLEKLGFEVISQKNEGFRISREFRERLKEDQGEHFADAYASKLNNTHLIIGKKIDNPQDNVSSKNFWFEPMSATTKEESKENKESKIEPVNIHIDKAAREIEKESRGSSSKAKKPKIMKRILPESIPGLRSDIKDVKGEF